MTPLKTRVLHVCSREHLRPLRDVALRRSGYEVESVSDSKSALSRAMAQSYDLVLIDVEQDAQIPHAEELCDQLRKAQPTAIVAFACNWQVSAQSQCPDDVVRTEFNPEAFVADVRKVLKPI